MFFLFGRSRLGNYFRAVAESFWRRTEPKTCFKKFSVVDFCTILFDFDSVG